MPLPRHLARATCDGGGGGSRSWLVALCVALLCGAVAASAAAAPARAPDRAEPAPRRLQGIDVEEKLGASVPAALGFVDETDKPMVLSEMFDGEHPVVLTFNYSNCPMLCSLQLEALTSGLKQLQWTAGQQFRVVTVSLDPGETPDRLARFKHRTLVRYGRPEADPGWRFLAGSSGNVRALADAVGFSYAYNEARQEWIHPAALTVLSPRGKVARYLYGLEYPAQTLRLALAEASEGKVGSSVDRILLFCFHYDETEGRYAPHARNIMRLGGALTVLVLGALLGSAWLREIRKRRRAVPAPASSPTG